MRQLTSNMVSGIQDDMEQTFFDVCKIGSYAESQDSYGDIVKSWVYGVDTKCGFQLLNGYERINGELTFTGITGRVRFAHDVVISTKDRVRFNGVDYQVRAITGKYSKVVDVENVGV